MKIVDTKISFVYVAFHVKLYRTYEYLSILNGHHIQSFRRILLVKELHAGNCKVDKISSL